MMLEDRHHKKKILVIDDDYNFSVFLKMALEQEHYEVLVEHSGKPGLASIKLHHPDLLIMDYEMPGLTGLDILKLLRENTETKLLPVIMMSGNLKKVFQCKGLCNSILEKPFSLQSLREAVTSCEQ